ncbi:39S ribosomal protein L24, mitochondrial [Gaertneriomyces sp. JEL0708]|nr:39S ribosomal protein L24, mitochondrial [Gaertneriomyces sp. JEL0708]
MVKAKFRFANLLKRRPKVAEHNRVPEQKWKIFPGDKVEIIGGRIDVGKQGTVVEVSHKDHTVTVEGCRMVFKHIKPNPDYPKGEKIRKETPISYTQVQLVDPTINKPTSVKLVKVRDPSTGRIEKSRISLLSQQLIPIPKEKDPFADKPVGPMDTAKENVTQETVMFNIKQCPFPSAFMNELERMRRRNKEAAAL